MGRKQIIGIYIAGHNLEFHCLTKGISGWRTAEPPWPPDSFSGPINEQLQKALSVLKPSKKYNFVIGFPRSQIFLREIAFEGLTEEEAENAIKLGIALHAHLPPEEIFFDQFAFKRDDKTVVLLAYIERKNLESLIDVFRETGHLKQLKAVTFPELGMDILLRKFNLDVPALSLGMQGEKWIVSMHGLENWEGSHLLSIDEENNIHHALQKLTQSLPEPFSNPELPIYAIGSVSLDQEVIKSPCNTSKEITKLCRKEPAPSWAFCTAAAGMNPYLPLSFFGSAKKRPVNLKIKIFPILAVITSLALIGTTAYYGYQYSIISERVKKLNQQLEKVEKQLTPFKEKEQKLKALLDTINDLDAFMKEYPSLLPILKALAETTPTDCYIKSLNLNGHKLRITALGKSAIDTMAKWREVPFFSNVRLVSPVTKDRNQNERFTVEITVKNRGKKK